MYFYPGEPAEERSRAHCSIAFSAALEVSGDGASSMSAGIVFSEFASRKASADNFHSLHGDDRTAFISSNAVIDSTGPAINASNFSGEFVARSLGAKVEQSQNPCISEATSSGDASQTALFSNAAAAGGRSNFPGEFADRIFSSATSRRCTSQKEVRTQIDQPVIHDNRAASCGRVVSKDPAFLRMLERLAPKNPKFQRWLEEATSNRFKQ